ncbi:unnamed protein product, partial [Mycena citricolor]
RTPRLGSSEEGLFRTPGLSISHVLAALVVVGLLGAVVPMQQWVPPSLDYVQPKITCFRRGDEHVRFRQDTCQCRSSDTVC